MKVETIIVRKTTYASKGPEVTLREFWDHKTSDVLRKPWETESKVANVGLRPNSIRESQLDERGITKTSSTRNHSNNFSKMVME